jgi:hypothetical protein
VKTLSPDWSGFGDTASGRKKNTCRCAHSSTFFRCKRMSRTGWLRDDDLATTCAKKDEHHVMNTTRKEAMMGNA